MRDAGLELLSAVVKPWYEAIGNPAAAQSTALRSLLEDYSRTDYGKGRGASPSMTLEEYRRSFEPVDYRALESVISRVSGGEFQALLPEAPATWVMTRGTTGTPKLLPVTLKHLSQIASCGARAPANLVIRTGKTELFRGKALNLNFPSRVSGLRAEGGTSTYGYSSGTYARIKSSFAGLGLVPPQEDIDALGGGITKRDWDARFELAYRSGKQEDVRICIGVAPVILSFARYVKRRHGELPKKFWKIGAIFCTSVPKIQWKYAPSLRSFYGDAPVVEMYTATEGVFAQQLDGLPYVTPNYDCYLFELVTRRGVKLLHEMKRGEWGRLLVSTCLLPRYDIGDMVECMGKHYFRVFGRARTRTLVEHSLYRALTRWFI